MSRMLDSQKARLKELKWLAGAKRERPLIATKLARVFSCAPSDIIFLDRKETERVTGFVDSKALTTDVEVPDRVAAIEFVKAASDQFEGEAVLLSHSRFGDYGAVALTVEQIISHLEHLLVAECENLAFVAPDGSFGVLLGVEEGIQPDLPRWVQVWHAVVAT